MAKSKSGTGGFTGEYLCCVFCGKNQYLGGSSAPFSGEVKPLEYKVLQIRTQNPGPGRGHHTKGEGFGFTVDRGASLTIEELMGSRPEIVKNIKNRLLTIVRAYIEIGVIDRRELQ